MTYFYSAKGEWREEDGAHGDALAVHEPERAHAHLYLFPLAPRCLALTNGEERREPRFGKQAFASSPPPSVIRTTDI